jgi:hypothetical protein
MLFVIIGFGRICWSGEGVLQVFNLGKQELVLRYVVSFVFVFVF